MNQSGPAIFFDGRTSARHAVSVELDRAALVARGSEGQILARWPYEELQAVSVTGHALRFARRRNGLTARLEIRDPSLISAIEGLVAPTVFHRPERRQTRRVMLWSVAAVIAFAITGTFGMPVIADRLTPFVPISVERKLGDVVDGQVRSSLDMGRSVQPLECGAGPAETAGRAVLDQMVARLAVAATLPFSLRVAVIRRAEANAFAAPGGRIYVYEGLVAKARTPDELAGVIAHEIGHVAHRDGTSSVIRATGLSFLLGMVLGDLVGGGAAVVAAKTLLQSAYSREVEAAADAYSVDLMRKVGGDARALGSVLARISGTIEPGMKMLMDHPETAGRVAAIAAGAPARAGPALLSPTEWAALKRICAGT